MKRKTACRKWNHDFSYNGKLCPHQIKCKNCGIGIVQWAEDRKEEYEKKLYGYNEVNGR